MYITGFLVIYTHPVHCQVLYPEEFSQEYMDFVIFDFDALFQIDINFLSSVQVIVISIAWLAQLNCRALYRASASAGGLYIESNRAILRMLFYILGSVFFNFDIHFMHPPIPFHNLCKKSRKIFNFTRFSFITLYHIL
jgi:hypothetical protein